MRSHLLVPALAMLGCGARTGDDLFFHPDVDAAIDVHVEPTTCPVARPSAGTACTGDLTCPYRFGKPCADVDARCTGGAWALTPIPSPSCTCPESRPARATPCGLPSETPCTYANDCGGTIRAVCRGGSWATDDPGCPTPCPATRPATGAPCPTEGKTCAWTNLCKTTDTGVCTAGKWKLDVQPCGTCPLFTPADGARCTTSAGCKYYLGGDDFCSTQCACDGTRWSCGPC